MQKALHALIVEDSVEDTEILLRELRQGGYEVISERVETPEAFNTALDRRRWDVVLADYTLPRFSGTAALELLKRKRLEVPFIFVSGTLGVDAAVEAIKTGADDYVMKSNLKRLLPIVQRELRESEMRRERKRAEENLQQSEERFRQLAENIAEVFWLSSPDMKEMLYISPGYEKVWGRSCQSLYERPNSWLDAIHQDDRERVAKSAMGFPSSGTYDVSYRIIRPDGSMRWIHDRAFPIRSASGEIYRLTGIAEDITQFKQAEEAMRKSEVLYRTLAEAAQDAIFLIDPNGYLQYVNSFAAWQLGRYPEEIVGKRHDDLFPPPVAEVQKQNIRKIIETGEPLYTEEELTFQEKKSWMSIRMVPLKNEKGGIDAILGIARDISERKRTEEIIQHIAFYDTPTGLPNRNQLYDHLLEKIKADAGGGMRMALLLMDLDRFREINDTLGHHRGDLLLQQLGERLQKTIFDRDMVARLGGDEFAILLIKLTNNDDIHLVIRKITRALEAPFVIEGIPIAVETSIGIALYPEQGTDPDTLIQRADIAMYAAKMSGSGHVFYTPEIDRYNPKRLALIAELRQAIEQNQLLLHYQPKIGLKDRKIFGVEALVRWKHPQHGMIPPDQFIGAAERTVLIHPLTHWVMQAAARQCADLQQAGAPMTVSANLSTRNLLDPKFPETVMGLLQTSGLRPEQLEFEITESAIMTDPTHAREVLVKLQGAGIRFSIDDFGIGYSSLSYLQKLPVHAIKIDKSFVIHMVQNEGDLKIVRSTIDLAHNLGLKVVAEGVETKEILDRLTDMGCDAAQGYFISRPIPKEDLLGWLQSPHHF
ncbi:MAG: EAL domain-containing protein [Candidatus Manganitrophus sp.]|nr:EAL domain-containing protein [Candidatus Manganitrophus sp.]